MSVQEVKVAYTGADPTAFGVMGLSLICFVASSSKLSFTDPKATGLLVVWAALLGGLVQIIASIIDFKKGNVFGGTVLGVYGFFWVGMAFSWATLNGMLGAGMKAVADPKQLGVVFVGYLIFSLFITIASFETNVPFIIILLLIDVLFFTLACVSFKWGPVALYAQIAGWSEFAISIVGFYAVGGIFFKNFYGRDILPMGAPMGLIKKAAPAPAPVQGKKVGV